MPVASQLSAADAASIASGVIAVGGVALGAWTVVRKVYAKTLGSRRRLTEQLRELSCGAHSDYVRKYFGVPSFFRSLDLSESVFTSPHALIQVITNPAETVISWAVTVTDPRFRPIVRLPIMDTSANRWTVHLGARYDSLGRRPSGISWSLGARRFNYTELYYFGNPGAYQTYRVSHNDAGTGDAAVELIHRIGELSTATVDPEEVEKLLANPLVKELRSKTSINIFSVSGPFHTPDPAGWPGVDLDFVRTYRFFDVQNPGIPAGRLSAQSVRGYFNRLRTGRTSVSEPKDT